MSFLHIDFNLVTLFRHPQEFVSGVIFANVNPGSEKAISEYKGKKYYFCAVDIQSLILHNVKGGTNYEYYPSNF